MTASPASIAFVLKALVVSVAAASIFAPSAAVVASDVEPAAVSDFSGGLILHINTAGPDESGLLIDGLVIPWNRKVIALGLDGELPPAPPPEWQPVEREMYALFLHVTRSPFVRPEPVRPGKAESTVPQLPPPTLYDEWVEYLRRATKGEAASETEVDERLADLGFVPVDRVAKFRVTREGELGAPQLHEFLGVEEWQVKLALPPDVPRGYEKIPPAQVKKTLAAMQAWLDREAAAQLPPEVRRPRELFRRARRLLGRIAYRTERSAWTHTDRRGDLGPDAPRRQIERLMDGWGERGPLAGWVLGPAGRVGLDEPGDTGGPEDTGGPAEAPPAPTDPVPAAAVAYLRAAVDSHPLFADLGAPLNGDRQVELIDAREKADLPDDEAGALRSLRAALWKAADLPGEAPPPPKNPLPPNVSPGTSDRE